MNKHIYFERECIHREEDSEGRFYNGAVYIQYLQRLPGREALDLSTKVAPFFWSDAPHVVVWLCRDCAATLRLPDTSFNTVNLAERRVVNW